MNLPVEGLIFALSAAIAVVSSILTIEHKSTVYAAFFLGVLGVSNAILISLLGFTIISVFMLAVYVGTVVIFILFSVTLMRETESSSRKLEVTALISSTMMLLVIFYTFTFFRMNPPSHTPYMEIVKCLISEYKFPLVVATLTLATTIIEAIALAVRGVRK